MDGVCCALELFQTSLQSERYIVERFWNTPTVGRTTPKKENVVSNELREVIKNYFRERAVVVDREVELHHRVVPAKDGGEQGDIVDLLCTQPGMTSQMLSDPIVVPIEVKRSCNTEAKTAIKSQLVDRYIKHAGTLGGVFVLAWLHSPNLKSSHKPQWDSLKNATTELEKQADELSRQEGLEIRVAILDLSLN